MLVIVYQQVPGVHFGLLNHPMIYKVKTCQVFCSMFSFKGWRQFLSPPLHTYKEPDVDVMFSIIPTAHLKVYASQALNALKGLHLKHFWSGTAPENYNPQESISKTTYVTNIWYTTDLCTTDIKLFYISKYNHWFTLRIPDIAIKFCCMIPCLLSFFHH